MLKVHGSFLVLQSPCVVHSHSVVQLVMLLHSNCSAIPYATDSMVQLLSVYSVCLVYYIYVVHLLSVHCTFKKCTAFSQCSSFFGPMVVSVQQPCFTAFSKCIALGGPAVTSVLQSLSLLHSLSVVHFVVQQCPSKAFS